MRTVSKHLDLVTSEDARVDGFFWQATEKSVRAARILKAMPDLRSLLKDFDGDIERLSREVKDVLLAAAGMSQKALQHIPPDQQTVLLGRIVDASKLSDIEYQEELVKRALLTIGDSLGGEMRNVVGQRAQRLLADAISQALARRGISAKPTLNKSGKLTALEWPERLLLFDKKPKFIGKSIDFILLRLPRDIEKPSAFLACGELKGGIDPAGADEHWKTARSAFERIRYAFTGSGIAVPKLYFVGSAIEEDMAKEIFDQIARGDLQAAANLNYVQQMQEAMDLLVSL